MNFSGWALSSDFASFPLGGRSWGTNANGVANISCGADCATGDSYSLYYTATIPPLDPSGFGGVRYRLTLRGTIAAVPVPAAVWLLGSGLLGLMGLARNKKPA